MAKFPESRNMTKSEYHSVHLWMQQHFGKSMVCEHCGQTKSRVDWANLSGNYLKVREDWKRLCRSCHIKLDRPPSTLTKEYCINGHRMVITNLVIRRRTSSGVEVECRQCRHDSWWKYKRKQKEKQS